MTLAASLIVAVRLAPMRLVFAGTPAVAGETLAYLLEHTDHTVVAVVTRPDAARGRSKQLVPSPVAQVAAAHGIEVLRPARPSEPTFAARLAELAPDACPVVAYGALVPAPVLAIPRHGWINVHYSLLPRWRGAAPVQRAILAGDTVTGVSVFRLVAALDAGPLFATEQATIGESETAGELLGRLTATGVRLLSQVLDDVAAGTAQLTEQTEDGITLAPKLAPQDARLEWTRPAVELARVVRACNPSPMAWTDVDGERFRVLLAQPGLGTGLEPGHVAATKREARVGTGQGDLVLRQVQPHGRKPMPAADWARGLHGALVQLR
ncbi:MAG: methionyl-tRNA formyltransferase [Propionicimonas sp.]